MIRAFIMSLACLLLGCATSQQELEDYVQKYRSTQMAHKALAYAAYGSGGWIAAVSQGKPDLESARREALARCDEKAFTSGAGVRCAIMYENNEFVGSRPAAR